MKKYLLFSAVLLALAGCIPPGEPPEGAITVNVEKIPQTPAEKRERMINELTAVLISNVPGGTIQFRADNASFADIYMVLNECAKVTGVTCDRTSPWILTSRYTETEWIVDLTCRGKTVQTIRIQR